VPSLLSGQPLRTAKERLSEPRRCTEADLRRATSDLYYALFHRICEALVQPLGADPDSQAFKETWTTIYRLPEHGLLVRRCKEIGGHAFSQDVKAFAQLITALRTKREDADYDPLAIFKISDVRNDVAQVDDLLTRFEAVDRAEQARFAWFVSLNRKGRGKDT
jgi:hypothetical protein